MSTLFISDFLNTPLKFFLPKMWHKATSKIVQIRIYSKDKKKPSFSSSHKLTWQRIFDINDLPITKENDLPVSYYKRHLFDVLGSGWICWNYGNKAPGMMGHCYADNFQIKEFDAQGHWLDLIVNNSNLETSKLLWKEILSISPDYKPIDWQKDVKSGFRFPQKQHASRLKIIPGLPGVDVKVPWEFARLQHLPIMVICAMNDQEKKEAIIDEIKCQLLDFILSNPPRWGIHWTSAMEVGIRLLNITLTLEILLQLRPEMVKSDFYTHVTESMADHLNFAWRFREHKNGLSNNHYLANLTGILYASYALIKNPEFEEVFYKTACELWREMDKQFLEDGGNFESSTAYHAFSTEISVLALALLKKAESNGALSKDCVEQDLRKAVLDKIQKASIMLDWLEIESGMIPQLGDNDSARMLMLSFPSEVLSKQDTLRKYKNLQETNVGDAESFLDRDYLNYQSTLDMAHSLFGLNDDKSLHSALIQSISGNSQLTMEGRNVDLKLMGPSLELKYTNESSYSTAIPEKEDLLEGLKSKAFPAMGLYFFKSPKLYLCVNGMNRHVSQYWPHGHNDKLSFELWIDGMPIVQDPGSFVYTSLPDERNKFRGNKAHAIAEFNSEEQNRYLDGIPGVFRLKNETIVELISFKNDAVKLKLSYRNYIQVREIIIEKNKIRILDSANHPFSVNEYPKVSFSNGYGKLLN